MFFFSYCSILLLDNVVGHQISFMNSFSGYNQIYIAPEDEEKITFYPLIDTYCYTVKPFGLQNTGTT